MNIDIKKEINEISADILKIRRDIHSHPETGNCEFRTASLIEKWLNDAGLKTRRVTDTGITGLLTGGHPGKTAVLRADMDALPVSEETGAAFSSEIPGVMHACGHDVHTAAALGAARVLAKHSQDLCGNIIFLFQPDEEGDGGAARMIDAGAIERADAVFGAHMDPDIPEGHAGVRYGKFYAAADIFDVAVTGKGSHAAEPEKGVDALGAAAEMVSAISRIPAEVTDDPCILTSGTFFSGTARNILADKAVFSGIVRTLGEETRSAIESAFRKTITDISAERGVKTDISYVRGYPGIVNDDEMTAMVKAAAEELLGPEKVLLKEQPTMKTEDFGYYLKDTPGAFYHIGAGCSEPLHSPRFLPSDEAVITAAAVHVAVLCRFFDTHTER